MLSLYEVIFAVTKREFKLRELRVSGMILLYLRNKLLSCRLFGNKFEKSLSILPDYLLSESQILKTNIEQMKKICPQKANNSILKIHASWNKKSFCGESHEAYSLQCNLSWRGTPVQVRGCAPVLVGDPVPRVPLSPPPKGILDQRLGTLQEHEPESGATPPPTMVQPNLHRFENITGLPDNTEYI